MRANQSAINNTRRDAGDAAVYRLVIVITKSEVISNQRVLYSNTDIHLGQCIDVERKMLACTESGKVR